MCRIGNYCIFISKNIHLKAKTSLARCPRESDIIFKPWVAIPDVLPWRPGKTGQPGSPTTSLRSSNFWTIIQNASLCELTKWAPSRCGRSACISVGRLWCWWARTQWCTRPSEGIWKTTQLWRNCCCISREMWALCSPRRISLDQGHAADQ